jgi:hypothetical protein
MDMSRRKQKLTIDQLCENVGWDAKWEARGRTEGEERKAFSIAQNVIKMGLPRRVRKPEGLLPLL